MPPGIGLLAHSTHPPCHVTLYQPTVPAPAKTIVDTVIDMLNAGHRTIRHYHQAITARHATRTNTKDDQ